MLVLATCLQGTRRRFRTVATVALVDVMLFVPFDPQREVVPIFAPPIVPAHPVQELPRAPIAAVEEDLDSDRFQYKLLRLIALVHTAIDVILFFPSPRSVYMYLQRMVRNYY